MIVYHRVEEIKSTTLELVRTDPAVKAALVKSLNAFGQNGWSMVHIAEAGGSLLVFMAMESAT